MFGKKAKVEEEFVAEEKADLVVPKEQPKTVGMQGFTEDPKPVQAPAPAPAPVPAPEPKEQYQIIETTFSPTKGLYIYKIVTNKYLGELGEVYEA